MSTEPQSCARFRFGKVRHRESGRVFDLHGQIDLTIYRPIVGDLKVFPTMLSMETAEGFPVIPDPQPADIRFVEDSSGWRVAPFDPEPTYLVRELRDFLPCERVTE